MANDFKEYAHVMSMQQEELAKIVSGVAQLSKADFDPLSLKLGDVDLSSMTPDSVFQAVYTQAREEEADRALTVIKNCLDKIEMTVDLLEMQDKLMWATQGADVPALQECLAEDHKVVGSLSEQLSALKHAYDRSGLPDVLDKQEYHMRLGNAAERYIEIMRRDIVQRRSAAKEFDNAVGLKTLIETIYELRMDYLDAAIEDSAVLIHGMKSKLWEAAYIKTAIDEGVLQANPFLEDKIRENLEYCRKTQPLAAENVGAILRFSAKLYEMGDDAWGTKDFEVREYKSVPLNTLPIIKP